VQDIPNEQNSKVVDQGQVTETGKPVPQEAATPRRPIFKIFFTIYMNMYSMEFFSDHNGICYRKFDQRTAQRYCSCAEIFRWTVRQRQRHHFAPYNAQTFEMRSFRNLRSSTILKKSQKATTEHVF
jgi:hypothetical protein